MSNILATALAAKHRRGVAWEGPKVVDIVEHAHDRVCSQTDPEAMHDLKCQTRFGCVTFEVGQRQKIKWKTENGK